MPSCQQISRLSAQGAEGDLPLGEGGIGCWQACGPPQDWRPVCVWSRWRGGAGIPKIRCGEHCHSGTFLCLLRHFAMLDLLVSCTKVLLSRRLMLEFHSPLLILSIITCMQLAGRIGSLFGSSLGLDSRYTSGHFQSSGNVHRIRKGQLISRSHSISSRTDGGVSNGGGTTKRIVGPAQDIGWISRRYGSGHRRTCRLSRPEDRGGNS